MPCQYQENVRKILGRKDRHITRENLSEKGRVVYSRNLCSDPRLTCSAEKFRLFTNRTSTDKIQSKTMLPQAAERLACCRCGRKKGSELVAWLGSWVPPQCSSERSARDQHWPFYEMTDGNVVLRIFRVMGFGTCLFAWTMGTFSLTASKSWVACLSSTCWASAAFLASADIFLAWDLCSMETFWTANFFSSDAFSALPLRKCLIHLKILCKYQRRLVKTLWIVRLRICNTCSKKNIELRGRGLKLVNHLVCKIFGLSSQPISNQILPRDQDRRKKYLPFHKLLASGIGNLKLVTPWSSGWVGRLTKKSVE